MVDYALALFEAGDIEWIDMCFGDPLVTAKRLLRPMIMAGPWNDLICADFAGIEARVLFWLAKETEGLEMFRSGADIYCEMASTIYEKPVIKKDKLERQVGKQTILGSGYGMSGPKFRITCLTQAGVELSRKMARHVIRSYRKKYPGVPQFWYGTEAAAIEAVRDGMPTEYGGIQWDFPGGHFLFATLPSGRRLAYPFPHIAVEPMRIWRCEDEDGEETTVMLVGDQMIQLRLQRKLEEEGFKLIDPNPIIREKEVLRHWGEVKKRWVIETTYGGKLTENIDQAISRDLMAEAMLRLEAAGYPVILSVHDEIVSEIGKNEGDLEEFERIMSEVPAWAAGCPVAVEGWRGERYRK
jgi:DNA polymerase